MMPSTSRFVFLCAASVALAMGVGLSLGCSEGQAAAIPGGVDRPAMETMDIDGFFADLTEGGVRIQRVIADHAVYFINEGLFTLDNVKVEFFDGDGRKVVEELFCNDGVWYTREHADKNRKKSDMDLEGNVFYRSLESGSALRTERIYFNSTADRFSSDDPFVQLFLREDNSMLVLKGEGFETDKGFANWKYYQNKVQNQVYDEAEYRTLVGEPPGDAPSYDNYEGL